MSNRELPCQVHISAEEMNRVSIFKVSIEIYIFTLLIQSQVCILSSDWNLQWPHHGVTETPSES